MGWKVPKVAVRVSPSLCCLVLYTPGAALITVCPNKQFGSQQKQINSNT